eukprot:SAG31_NODE_9825_length_1223_cov_1.159253_2_plen_196_part_00
MGVAPPPCFLRLCTPAPWVLFKKDVPVRLYGFVRSYGRVHSGTGTAVASAVPRVRPYPAPGTAVPCCTIQLSAQSSPNQHYCLLVGCTDRRCRRWHVPVPKFKFRYPGTHDMPRRTPPGGHVIGGSRLPAVCCTPRTAERNTILHTCNLQCMMAARAPYVRVARAPARMNSAPVVAPAPRGEQSAPRVRMHRGQR